MSIIRQVICGLRATALTLVVPALALTPMQQANAQEGAALQWSVTPYMWATHTSYDLRLRDQNPGSGEISFDELLDSTDEYFMINVEAGRGRWSGLADISHLSMSDIEERALLNRRCELYPR